MTELGKRSLICHPSRSLVDSSAESYTDYRDLKRFQRGYRYVFCDFLAKHVASF